MLLHRGHNLIVQLFAESTSERRIFNSISDRTLSGETFHYHRCNFRVWRFSQAFLVVLNQFSFQSLFHILLFVCTPGFSLHKASVLIDFRTYVLRSHSTVHLNSPLSFYLKIIPKIQEHGQQTPCASLVSKHEHLNKWR